MDVKGLKNPKNLFIKVAVTENMYSLIFLMNMYLFKACYVLGTILDSNKRRTRGAALALPELIFWSGKTDIHKHTAKHKVNGKCQEGNPWTGNASGGKDTCDDEVPSLGEVVFALKAE